MYGKKKEVESTTNCKVPSQFRDLTHISKEKWADFESTLMKLHTFLQQTCKNVYENQFQATMTTDQELQP